MCLTLRRSATNLSEFCVIKVYPLLQHTVVAEGNVVSTIVCHHCHEIVLFATCRVTNNMLKHLQEKHYNTKEREEIKNGFQQLGGDNLAIGILTWKSRKRMWYSMWHFLSLGSGIVPISTACMAEPRIKVSDGSLFIDCYTVWFTKAWKRSQSHLRQLKGCVLNLTRNSLTAHSLYTWRMV